MILHTTLSNNRFVIHLEKYKRELSKCAHTLTSMLIANLLEMKTCQTCLLGKSIFSQFFLGALNIKLLEKQI